VVTQQLWLELQPVTSIQTVNGSKVLAKSDQESAHDCSSEDSDGTSI